MLEAHSNDNSFLDNASDTEGTEATAIDKFINMLASPLKIR